jgi:hypothetical protein
VVDCEPSAASIVAAINEGISPEFQQKLNDTGHPYEKASTASEIVSKIAAFDPAGLLKKRFNNIPMASLI